MKNRLRRLITLAEPMAGEHLHPSQRNSMEGELSGILNMLRILLEDILTPSEKVELDYGKEIDEYEERIKFLCGTQ